VAAEEAAILAAKQQPQPKESESKLAEKYAAIADTGERAFQILTDLGMFRE
jgi:hypothetical protein